MDFIYRQPYQQLPEGQATKLRQYLYMSFFMRFYSYGPDGKLDVIHKKLKESKPITNFPIDNIRKYMEERTGMTYDFSENMLYDLDLVLNIIRDGVYEIPKKKGVPKVFQREIDSKPLTVVDLFCGAGGSSLGYALAGFNIVLGIDIHKPSMETFLHNHPKAVGILGDIRKIPGEMVLELLDGVEVKVLMAGVPCQGFSLNNRKRNPNDPRNYLFLEFIRFVELLKPDFLVLENVSGMKSTANGSFVREIEKRIKIAGKKNGKRYHVEHRILNAADFGVPQIRKRLIFLASARDYPIVWPEPEFGTPDRPYRTVFDAIGDLPPCNRGRKNISTQPHHKLSIRR